MLCTCHGYMIFASSSRLAQRQRVGLAGPTRCGRPAARGAHDRLLVFAVDPQGGAERAERRLAVIADHLGFSWTGGPRPRRPPRPLPPGLTSCLFCRVGTDTGLERGPDRPDKERESRLAPGPEPRPFEAVGGAARSARRRLAAVHAQAKQAHVSADAKLFSAVSPGGQKRR